MEHKLKPCPNPECLSTGEKLHTLNGGKYGVQVSCADCGTSGPVSRSNSAAIAAWNKLPRNPQWTTYTGEEDTLPPAGVLCLSIDKDGFKSLGFNADRLPDIMNIGDRWTPWPGEGDGDV